MINSVNNNKNILLVDDDKSITQMLSMLLESRGYRVNIANTGKEAIDKAATTTDLILLDLVLPDQDGFDVCRRLKEKRKTSGIPIIILSARLFSGDIVEGLYMGADDYLTKPFEYEELVARMDAVMRRNSVIDGENIVSQAEQEMIVELRRIIEDGALVPFYQPIFMLNPFKVLGVEALSRPQTSTMLMNPEVLFKAAIQFGFYEDIERLAWKKAVENFPKNANGIKLFLNCNPYIIESKKFLSVRAMFEKKGLDPNNIVLEITERSAVKDFKVFYDHLKKYKNAGFSFAVDDVGAGFASLESIVETRPEIVKIDGHIVGQLSEDLFKRSLVKFIVNFCKENNILSIAEGVETKEELDILKKIGVDAVQGYYLYRPFGVIDFQDYKEVGKMI